MGRIHRIVSLVIGLAVMVVGAREASAAFHLMKVTEIYGGSPAAPNAQYVVLQMFTGGQNFVGGHAIIVYDAADAELGRFTFTGQVASGADQAKILIATTQAATFFNVSANLTMTAIIPRAGGKICFDTIDCVAWGTHPQATDVGNPLSPALGLPLGRAAVRRLDLFGSATMLDSGDDTNDSANDFRVGPPAPRNNAGQAGTVPTSTCGNTTTESIEGCDDGNLVNGDGCSATCLDEACGDTVVNDGGETCDDGNLTSGDGCDANCRITGCGNGVVTAGELCDDGNPASGDGCDANCRPTGCGNDVLTSGESCDDGNLVSGDGCDANCTATGCGNGVVTAGEDCEPPGVGSCDATCQLACVTAADCADGDPCTTNERCLPAGCAVDPTPTDDAESCTTDSCGPGGVVHAPLPDGMSCVLAGMPSPRALCVDAICGVARCGDGFTDTSAPGAEQCDDGNLVDTDACTNACTTARCGDAVVGPNEACDDGNAVDTDACTSACEAARCGDGFASPGEQCDDGNLTSGDGCTMACVAERCGDGIEQLGEQCDDGNQDASDGCSPSCQDEVSVVPAGADGGCCGTGGSAPTPLVIGAAVLGLLARRRRRPRA